MKKLSLISVILVFALIGSFTLGAAAFDGCGIEVIRDDVTLIKTGLVGKNLTFMDTDFKCALGVDDFEYITITALPSSNDGVLMLAGRRVREGQEISRRKIATMIFIPKDKNTDEAEMTFSLNGEGDYKCTMKFIDKVNYAPSLTVKASNEKLSTQADISVYGRLSAEDPEGDEIEYMIASYPKSGMLEMTENGGFRYTPCKNFTGYDKFVYVARDEYGNYSVPSEVIIQVSERMSEIVYKDMTDRREYNAAVAMSAMGIMTGTQLGDDFYFNPDEGITRGEFVAMALKSMGISPAMRETFFDDNEDIPSSLRGYAARAASLGIIDGERHDGELVFKANEGISAYEAASIMARLSGSSGGEGGEYLASEGVPVYARADVEAMITLGVIDIEMIDISKKLTRGDAAEFLYNLVKNC